MSGVFGNRLVVQGSLNRAHAKGPHRTSCRSERAVCIGAAPVARLCGPPPRPLTPLSLSPSSPHLALAVKQDLLLAFVDCVERNGAKLARQRLQLEVGRRRRERGMTCLFAIATRGRWLLAAACPGPAHEHVSQAI